MSIAFVRNEKEAAQTLQQTEDRPLNMALNEGTYAPEACREVFQRFALREACRRYSSSDNAPLKERLAMEHKVRAENIFLGHGSGPLLKEGIVGIVRSRIMRSPKRMLRYALRRPSYPVITPVPSYSKVAAGAVRNKLGLVTIPLDRHNGWSLDLGALEDALRRRDGLVYLCNPNNPTGNALIKRDELLPLLGRYPQSTFWVDEAYVQYLEPSADLEVADLVRQYPNLIVSRSFSFAYGLAAVRLGYLIATPTFIADLERKHVPYRQGLFQEELALAALNDVDHLPFVRRKSAEARQQVLDAMAEHPRVEVYPSDTHYLLCRMRDGRPVQPFIDAMRRRGIALRVFEPVAEHRFDDYFRITLGTEPENQLLIDNMLEELAEAQA